MAFDTPVAREYLGPDGLFAAPGDVAGLAKQLVSALSVSRQPCGQRLRERAVKGFGWDEAGHQILAIYRRLLGETDTLAQSRQKCLETNK